MSTMAKAIGYQAVIEAQYYLLSFITGRSPFRTLLAEAEAAGSSITAGRISRISGDVTVPMSKAVSYTHLTLPTKA